MCKYYIFSQRFSIYVENSRLSRIYWKLESILYSCMNLLNSRNELQYMIVYLVQLIICKQKILYCKHEFLFTQKRYRKTIEQVWCIALHTIAEHVLEQIRCYKNTDLLHPLNQCAYLLEIRSLNHHTISLYSKTEILYSKVSSRTLIFRRNHKIIECVVYFYFIILRKRQAFFSLRLLCSSLWV